MTGMTDDVDALSPGLFMTHDVTYDQGTVVKRFQSWGRAESEREWQALNLLAEHAPGLAPEPISADLASPRPVIVMSLLPGNPLSRGLVTDIELDAAAEAIDRLHRALPASRLAAIEGPGNLDRVESKARQMAADCNTDALDSATRDAYGAALAWLDRDWAGSSAAAIRWPVFAQGDGNLANYLWDGREVRIVDFEDAGRGDRVQELAEFVEHLAVWNRGGVDADAFLDRFDLSPAERSRATQLRRLFAVFWLMMLLPGGPSHRRNPPGTLDCQVSRLQGLLHH